LGADTISGGWGIDTGSWLLATSGVAVNMASGVHTGEAAGDAITSVERFLLSNHGDGFTGGSLWETIYGYAGDDRIDGGAGSDWLHGGTGNDTFVFTSTAHSSSAARDRIADLSAGDRIDLSAIDANLSLAGDQAFSRVGGAFTGAGQLRLVLDGGSTRLELNTDEDAAAEAIVMLTGIHTAADLESGWVL
jgi:Ca2+-binding RTX toxin-like protein